MLIDNVAYKELTATQFHKKKNYFPLYLRTEKLKFQSCEKRTIVYVYTDDLCFSVVQNERAIGYTVDYPSKIFHASEIKGYEIIIDDSVVERKSSNFGKMVAGGLLFGALGAFAGAVDKGGTTKTTGKKSYSVRLILNDLRQASLDIKCDSNENAYRLLHTLALLEEKYYHLLNEKNEESIVIPDSNNTEKPSISYAEEIIKLKELKDDGVITEEEFKTFKSKLTSS
jgi:hypothetical protein